MRQSTITEPEIPSSGELKPPLTIRRRTWWGLRRRAVLDPDAASSWRERLGEMGIFSPLPRLSGQRPFQVKRNRALYRLEGTSGAPAIILKHERFPFPAWLLTFPIRPIGLQEMRNLRRVESLGVPAVHAIAAGEVGWVPFFFETYVATVEIPGGYNLSDWLRDEDGRPQADFPREEVIALLPGIAEAVGRLHRARFYGRTLFAKNILIYRDGAGRVRYALHDLPRSRWRPGRPLALRRAANDLACLDKWAHQCLSRSVRLRLLERYRAALGEGPPLRTWIERVLRRRDLLLRRTFLTWALHRTRRRAKKLPGIGRWFR